MARTRKDASRKETCWAWVIGKCTPLPGQCTSCPFFTLAASIGLTPTGSIETEPIEFTLAAFEAEPDHQPADVAK